MEKISRKIVMIDAEYLRSRVHYDHDTGIFTWLPTGNQRIDTRIVGKTAGTRRGNYIVITIYQSKYYAHRLAWLYMTGELPPSEIDHIDRDGSNNRFANLRLATRSQNLANTQSRSASGLKGVTWHKRQERWRASITHGGVSRHLGYFDHANDAAEAYAAAAQAAFGDFAYLGRV